MARSERLRTLLTDLRKFACLPPSRGRSGSERYPRGHTGVQAGGGGVLHLSGKDGEAGRVLVLGGLHVRSRMRTRLVTWKGWTGEGSSLSPTGPMGGPGTTL